MRNVLFIAVLFLSVNCALGQGRITRNNQSISQTSKTTEKKYAVFKASDFSVPTGVVSGHDYVDLGLSAMWATCNIGASKINECGYFYGWGELGEKGSYTQYNCKTIDKELPDISGSLEYDAATSWGKRWQMPTKLQFEELLNNCHWEWGKYNDTFGYRITGANGNSIFLPATGEKFGFEHRNWQETGSYWTSTPSDKSEGYASMQKLAYLLNFGKNSHYLDYFGPREYGRSVRPVISK